MTTKTITDDDLEWAKELLLKQHKLSPLLTGCISYIQRKMLIGYSYAAAIIEKLQDDGFITEPDHTGARRLR